MLKHIIMLYIKVACTTIQIIIIMIIMYYYCIESCIVKQCVLLIVYPIGASNCTSPSAVIARRLIND